MGAIPHGPYVGEIRNFRSMRIPFKKARFPIETPGDPAKNPDSESRGSGGPCSVSLGTGHF